MEHTGTTTAVSTKPAMIPVQEAMEIVLTVARRLPPVTVPIHEALGKVLAEDIRAPDPLPPYPASVKVNVFNAAFMWPVISLAIAIPQSGRVTYFIVPSFIEY